LNSFRNNYIKDCERIELTLFYSFVYDYQAKSPVGVRSMNETDILYENGKFWVGKARVRGILKWCKT